MECYNMFLFWMVTMVTMLKCVFSQSGSGDNWLEEQRPAEEEWDSTWKQYTEWDIGIWSQCSTACGESYRSRSVQCIRNDIIMTNLDVGDYMYDNISLVVIDDVYCDDKPKDQELCKTSACTPEWVAEEWSQCDPWCGKIGFRTRSVRCIGGSNTTSPVVYSPHICDNTLRPHTTNMCDNGPCSHMTWDVGSWSTCSSRCGRGFRIRRISCVSTYTGERMVPSKCHYRLRPISRTVCKGSCGVADESSDYGYNECQDDTTVRYCYLVLKFRLCSNDFFHKMCCLSCRSRASYPFM